MTYFPSKSEQKAWGCAAEVIIRQDHKGRWYFWCLAGIAILRDDKTSIAYILN